MKQSYANNSKKLFFAFVIAVLFAQRATATETSEIKPPLEHKSIVMVDGLPHGLNGPGIARLIHILKEVDKFQYGIVNPLNGERIGKYILKGEEHSVYSLMQCEHSLETATIAIAEKEHLRAALKSSLKMAIDDFVAIMQPFITQARGSKAITITLMEEWAQLHERTKSFILNWSRQKEGTEIDMFREGIDSFEKLNQFCSDLVSFIQDLIQSCPKGWKQYLALVEQHKKK